MSDDEDAGDRALGADRIDDYGLEVSKRDGGSEQLILTQPAPQLGPGAPKAEMLARTVLTPQHGE
jgi:hypothetical protein